MHLNILVYCLCNLFDLCNFWVIYEPLTCGLLLCHITLLHYYTIIYIYIHPLHKSIIWDCLKLITKSKIKIISYVYTGKRKKQGNCVISAKKQNQYTHPNNYPPYYVNVNSILNANSIHILITHSITRGV